MILQTTLDVDTEALIVLFMLLFVMVLITYLNFKFRVFYIMVAVWGFGVVMGIQALQITTPLTPYFEILYLLYINLVFIWSVIDNFTQ